MCRGSRDQEVPGESLPTFFSQESRPGWRGGAPSWWEQKPSLAACLGGRRPRCKEALALAGGRKPHLFKKKSRGKSCAGVVIFAIIESVCRAAAKKKLFLPGKGKAVKQRSHRQRKQRQGGNGEEATARRPGKDGCACRGYPGDEKESSLRGK